MTRSLGLTLDPSTGEHLYLQVFDQLAARIRSGALPPGFRLPPTRALAEELGAHRNTVVRAYEALADAGFTTSAVGRGTFVARCEPVAAPAHADAGALGELPWASLVSRAAAMEPLRRVDRAARLPGGRGLINLTRTQPPDHLLPTSLLQRCIDHVLRTAGARALASAPREGIWPLREHIAVELSSSGVPATADDVLVTSGSQQALDLVVRALVNPGDAFLVEESTYSGAINLLYAAGARLMAIPADEEGPDLFALGRLARAGAKGLYLMPNCASPAGGSTSPDRRKALVEWSHGTGVPLVEDDHGADLHLDGAPPPALRALSSEVIHVGSFSARLTPALRVGFVVCPRSLQRHLVPLKYTMDLGTSTLLQYALAEFIDRGYLEAHMRRVIPEYRARRDALVRGLSRHMPDGVSWHRPASGVVIWLTLPPGVDPEAVFEQARRGGVLVTPGTFNRVSAGGGGRGALRLVFCHETPRRLARAARLLAEAMEQVSARPQTTKRPLPLEMV